MKKLSFPLQGAIKAKTKFNCLETIFCLILKPSHFNIRHQVFLAFIVDPVGLREAGASVSFWSGGAKMSHWAKVFESGGQGGGRGTHQINWSVFDSYEIPTCNRNCSLKNAQRLAWNVLLPTRSRSASHSNRNTKKTKSFSMTENPIIVIPNKPLLQ